MKKNILSEGTSNIQDNNSRLIDHSDFISAFISWEQPDLNEFPDNVGSTKEQQIIQLQQRIIILLEEQVSQCKMHHGK